MNKSKFFVLFLLITAICLVSFSAVLADQEGNRRWCNSDQYGCWVTDENGGQSYLMFFSESARDLFMGPGSSAPVVPAVPGGEMGLSAAPEEPKAPAAPAAPANGEENAGGENAGNNDPKHLKLAEKYADILIETDPLHFGAGSYDRDELVQKLAKEYNSDQIEERLQKKYKELQ